MVFNAREAADPDDPLKLPCGQCIGCRLARSQSWAIRCVHEAQLWPRNCFITLTFAPEHLPESGSLDKRDFQLFMKKLRKEFGPGIRYFHCGEYGEKNRRPHYHACLFNFDFDDRELWSTRSGVRLDISPTLERIWGLGFCTVGDVTFESAAYVARYITKKITGDAAARHYTKPVLRPDGSWIGEIQELLPEYTTMSRGSKKLGTGGIGRGWLDLYTNDVYSRDAVVMRKGDGSIRLCPPPKYYDSVFELANPQLFEDVKEARKLKAVMFAKDSSYRRLRVREQIQYLRFKCLKRGYENDL